MVDQPSLTHFLNLPPFSIDGNGLPNYVLVLRMKLLLQYGFHQIYEDFANVKCNNDTTNYEYYLFT